MSNIELLSKIIQDIQNETKGLTVSNVCFDMPGLHGIKSELAHFLAYSLHNHLEGTSINHDSSVEERRYAYNTYTKLRAKLKKLYTNQAEARNASPSCTLTHKLSSYHKARLNIDYYRKLKENPLSEQIVKPAAMPVDIAPVAELNPFFDRLMENSAAIGIKSDSIGSYEQFTRGAYYTDGRIDLCKQVVGPPHIATLMDSFRNNSHVEHFLLGNNIIGTIGAAAIAAFISDPNKKSNIKTWYIAGNDIDSTGMSWIAKALESDSHCTQLWLKRNPIGIFGAKSIAEMLNVNNTLQVLDLDNTAVFDDGAIAIFEALKTNKTLWSIYIDANGLTERTAAAIADYFRHCVKNSKTTLTHLSISINRLGDAGAKLICDALRETNYPLKCLVIGGNRIELDGLRSILDFAESSKTLEALDIGYYKSTADMGELPNSFGNDGARLIAKFILSNTPLQFLSFHNTHITDLGIIEGVIPYNDNLVLISPEQFNLSSSLILNTVMKNFVKKHPDISQKNYIRKLKHGSNIWVIDSIYRNNM